MDEQGMTKKTVSVVVPMYNCAEFLPDFFQMMFDQTMEDFELICVVDGATDNTLEVVKQYADKDGRIKWFYKENGGAGSARNVGLRHAIGKYVIFIDADDLYKADLLKDMVNAAEKHQADMVLCLIEQHDLALETVKENIGFNQTVFPDDFCVDPNEIRNLFQVVGSGPTNKLYRRSFVEENNLSFSETKVSNDVFFISASSAVAKRIVGIHKTLIITQRYANTASITSNRGKHTDDVPGIFVQLYQWLKERDLHERLHDSFCSYFMGSISYNAQFGTNPKFIEGVVHVLNEEEPWASMTSEELSEIVRRGLKIRRTYKRIRMLEAEINKDDHKASQANKILLEKMRNKAAVYAIVDILSDVRYGRGFKTDQQQYDSLDQLVKFPAAQKKLEQTREKLKAIRTSKSYKTGAKITCLPRRLSKVIRSVFK